MPPPLSQDAVSRALRRHTRDAEHFAEGPSIHVRVRRLRVVCAVFSDT